MMVPQVSLLFGWCVYLPLTSSTLLLRHFYRSCYIHIENVGYHILGGIHLVSPYHPRCFSVSDLAEVHFYSLLFWHFLFSTISICVPCVLCLQFTLRNIAAILKFVRFSLRAPCPLFQDCIDGKGKLPGYSCPPSIYMKWLNPQKTQGSTIEGA